MAGRWAEPAAAVSRTASPPDEPRSHGHDSSPGAASENQTTSRAASALPPSSSREHPLGKGDAEPPLPSSHASPKPSTTTNPGWYETAKSWLSVSEPSARALKQQRVSAYQRHGIHLDDPDAAAKMHVPIGKLPDGVTTSTTGPDPEEALRERATRDAACKPPSMQHGAWQSRSSGVSSDQHRA